MQARRGIELYFHGGGYPLRWRQSPQRTAAGVMHRLMTWLVVRSARRVFVVIPEWQRHLRRLGVRESDRDRVVTWVPVPSTVPDHADAGRVQEIRATLAPSRASSVVGHFGRYGAFHQRLLPPLVERVLDSSHLRTMLLVGHGSGAVRDTIAIARPDLAALTWRARVARTLTRRLDRVAVSRATVAVASGRGVPARTGIGRVIAGGVDVEHFTIADRGAARRILFIGTLHGAGGGGWLYDLFRERIAPCVPDAELHLIADVAPPSQPWMRFEALRGDVDRAAAYRDACVLVVPATQADADPTLLEAMASGMPVLATPTVGAVDLLGNGKFGILADDAVFVDALLRLLGDDATQQRLAVAARARAEELSWQRVAASYRDVYESAMINHVQGR